MERSEETVTVPYDEFIIATELAELYQIGDEKVWIPKSQIRLHDEEEHEIDIPEWLAIEKELV